MVIYSIGLSIFKFDYGVNHLIASSLSVFFWLFCTFIFISINIFITRFEIKNLQYFAVLLFNLNFALTLFQYISFSIYMKHPFPHLIHEATGDYLMGFWGNANVNMIYNTCSGIYFLSIKKLRLSIIAIIIAILTTFNGGILILGFSIFLFIITSRAISKRIKFSLIIISIISSVAFYFIAYSNISYAIGYLERSSALNDFTPLKIVSFIETLTNWTSDVTTFIFGEGPANYSSRVAFLVSGHYVDWWPENLTYISEAFKNGNLYLWFYKSNSSFTDVNSFANQPNNVFAQFIGEYGMIGLLLLFYYLYYWYRNSQHLGRLMFIFFIGILFTDYWFEFLNVVPFFEFYFLLFIKTKRTQDY